MLNFAQNSRFKFCDCLFYCITTPSLLVFRHLSYSDSWVSVKVLLSIVVFLYLGPQFTLCKLLFLLTPFSNTTGHTYHVCATFLYWFSNNVLCARLLLPKVAISPSAPTECQTVNRFGHITNSVSVEKATMRLRLWWILKVINYLRNQFWPFTALLKRNNSRVSAISNFFWPI